MAIQLPGSTPASNARFNHLFDKLPPELAEKCIEYAVADDSTIDLRDFDQVVDELTGPFKSNPGYLKIAENAFLRSNTFYISGTGTTVDRLPRDIGRKASRWSRATQEAIAIADQRRAAERTVEKKKTTGESPQGLKPINFSDWEPFLFASFGGSQLSADSHGLTHLTMAFSIVVEGHDFDWSPTYQTKPSVRTLMFSLGEVFPLLRSLEVKVRNTCSIRGGAMYLKQDVIAPAIHLPEYVFWEIGVKMISFMEMTATPRLRSHARRGPVQRRLKFESGATSSVCPELTYRFNKTGLSKLEERQNGDGRPETVVLQHYKHGDDDMGDLIAELLFFPNVVMNFKA